MRKIPELLAPVGGMLQLRAAVENGADAVYLGMKQFNARINADNFDEKQLEEAVDYAHLRGVKVHLTMNTLLRDEELAGALETAFFAYEIGVDALIIQDLGMAKLLRMAIPEMELHLSTQGTIYNVQGVQQAAALGFSRVVLAREVNLKELESITSQTDTEIEVFVHGALCIGYSGQCQMSRAIGGRSGNRGVCAQPCRLPYELYEQGGEQRAMQSRKGVLLSPKDLCLLDYLPQLAQAGVASLKLEGRMKSPEYVGVVTSVYRKYLDLYGENGAYVVQKEDQNKLEQVFNRGGFSTGYLLGNPRSQLMCGELAKHQGVFLGVVVGQNQKKKQVDILLEKPLTLGDGIEIRNFSDPERGVLPGNVVTYLEKADAPLNTDGDAGERVSVGDIVGYCKPGDSVYKITDRRLMQTIRTTYEKKSGEGEKQLRKRAVGVYFWGNIGKPAKMTLWDLTSDLCVCVESESIAEAAIHRPLTVETIRAQLDKTGGTPFRICHWDVKVEEGLSIAVSVLNRLRRDGLKKLEQQLIGEYKHPLSVEEKETRSGRSRFEEEKTTWGEVVCFEERASEVQGNGERKSQTPGDNGQSGKLSVYLHRADVEAVQMATKARFPMPDGTKKKVSRLYVPYDLFLNQPEEILDEAAQTMELIPYMPTITKGSYDAHIKQNFRALQQLAVKRGIAIGNQGWLSVFLKEGATVYGDYGLNIYNSVDFHLAIKMGLKQVVLSHEFDGEEQDFQGGGTMCEVALGGAVPLLISAHCFVGDLRGTPPNTPKNCGLCEKKHYFLKDRKNETYGLLPDERDCSSMVLSAKTGIDKKKYEWCKENGIGYMRIYGIDKRMFSERT